MLGSGFWARQLEARATFFDAIVFVRYHSDSLNDYSMTILVRFHKSFATGVYIYWVKFATGDKYLEFEK